VTWPHSPLPGAEHSVFGGFDSPSSTSQNYPSTRCFARRAGRGHIPPSLQRACQQGVCPRDGRGHSIPDVHAGSRTCRSEAVGTWTNRTRTERGRMTALTPTALSSAGTTSTGRQPSPTPSSGKPRAVLRTGTYPPCVRHIGRAPTNLDVKARRANGPVDGRAVGRRDLGATVTTGRSSPWCPRSADRRPAFVDAECRMDGGAQGRLPALRGFAVLPRLSF
jgi:hypothetical protein